ncbi:MULTISPECIES: DUF2336 domain-containing protein [Sphingomonas]|uniref:DUF2336 domain-containing protein n=1 Tax=Sphingomonas TaxID=13687 RepID=UPI0014460F04|nr:MULTISPECIES: DUF2336 domain-containing protein [Sphingomonas]
MRAARGVDRLGAAMTDLSLDPLSRPSEQERALMLSLLSGLVGQIAEELLLRVPDADQAEVDAEEVVADLRAAGLLGQRDLVGLLVRRADVLAFRSTARQRPGGGLLETWGADSNHTVVSATMAVVIARASARDRFGRPGLTLADCDAETAVTLTYAVAAALRGPADALVAAAVDMLARHDEGERLDAREARLMLALEQAGKLDAGLLMALALEGEAVLLAEGLARLARIPAAEAWQMLTGRNERAVGRLLRLAELDRTAAAGLIAALGEARSLGDPGEAMVGFDAMTSLEISTQRAAMRLPPAFLAARAAFERHGQRRV